MSLFLRVGQPYFRTKRICVRNLQGPDKNQIGINIWYVFGVFPQHDSATLVSGKLGVSE